MKKSHLHFAVTLDEQKVPHSIEWHSSPDDNAGPPPQVQPAHALNVSAWNDVEGGTMKIGLWTKNMPIDRMRRFFIDSVGAIAADVPRATDDVVMGSMLENLCDILLVRLTNDKPIEQLQQFYISSLCGIVDALAAEVSQASGNDDTDFREQLVTSLLYVDTADETDSEGVHAITSEITPDDIAADTANAAEVPNNETADNEPS